MVAFAGLGARFLMFDVVCCLFGLVVCDSYWLLGFGCWFCYFIGVLVFYCYVGVFLLRAALVNSVVIIVAFTLVCFSLLL